MAIMYILGIENDDKVSNLLSVKFAGCWVQWEDRLTVTFQTNEAWCGWCVHMKPPASQKTVDVKKKESTICRLFSYVNHAFVHIILSWPFIQWYDQWVMFRPCLCHGVIHGSKPQLPWNRSWLRTGHKLLRYRIYVCGMNIIEDFERNPSFQTLSVQSPWPMGPSS